MLIRVLFGLWMLSLAAYQYPLVGSLSLDNLLAPVLLVLVLLFPPGGLGSVLNRPLGASALPAGLLLFGLYALAHLVPRFGDPSLFAALGFEVAKAGLYFVLPLLLVVGQRERDIALWALVGVACLAGLSNLAASLGWLEFAHQRFAPSRIGLEGLPRSIGLLGNYGDMAIVSALALVTVLAHRARARLGVLLVWLVVGACLLAGLLGSQSRNLALTLGCALLVYPALAGWARLSAPLANAVVLALGCAVALLGLWDALDPDQLVDYVRHWGGAQAAATADDRLSQYDFAMGLIDKNPWLGAPEAAYYRHRSTVEGIHNLWLRETARSGLLGAASLAVMFAAVGFKALRRLRASHGQDTDALIAATLVVAMLLATQFYVAGNNCLWVLLGLALALTHTRAANERPLPRATAARPPGLAAHPG